MITKYYFILMNSIVKTFIINLIQIFTVVFTWFNWSFSIASNILDGSACFHSFLLQFCTFLLCTFITGYSLQLCWSLWLSSVMVWVQCKLAWGVVKQKSQNLTKALHCRRVHHKFTLVPPHSTRQILVCKVTNFAEGVSRWLVCLVSVRYERVCEMLLIYIGKVLF